jgi:hypothetical protein
MSTPVKVAAFVMALAIAFLGARAVGSIVRPDVDASTTMAHDDGDDHSNGTEAGHGDDHDDEEARPPGGLAVSQDGYTLRIVGEPRPGVDQPLRFVIEGPDGHPVTTYDEVHDRPLHLVKVRRDFHGYQHVHPIMAEDGTWTARVTLAPGSTRVLADFTPTGGPALVLGTDVQLAGEVDPAPNSGTVRTARVDGYQLTLRGELRPGEASGLDVTITHRGQPVTDLQPYLGAYGHLVALREGDLGYLHVHPLESEPGPVIPFVVEVPSPGGYRLFLDFKHDGVVRTAEFALSAEGAGHDH